MAAITSVGQSKRRTPPAEPRVRPIIERHYENDADGNGIDDELDHKVKAATVSEGTNLVEVRLVFTSQITQQQIDDFEKLGGVIDYVFQTVSYGWTGRIPLNKVGALRATLGNNLILVHSPRPGRLHLLNATQVGRVRPTWVANFAGYTPGFSGSNDTTIGIIDTGVDSTHQDLTNRCLYWKDQSSNGYSTNKDIDQHGTHVAGIALGTGSASGSSAGPLSFTLIGNLAGVSAGAEYINPITLPTNSVTWKVGAKWDGNNVATTVETKSSAAGKNNFTQIGGSFDFSPASYTNTFSPNVSNIYMTAVQATTGLTNYVITNNLSYYPSGGDGFNRMRGVASGCKYVAEKVFTDAGANSGSWTYAAIDDLVTKRTTYNVKVINMSLGSFGADTTLRSDANNAVNNGIVVVSSAGNDGPNGNITDPGSARLAICVAAANNQVALTSYSSIGTNNIASGADYKPDLMAPGGSFYYGGILSADSNSGDGTNFADQVANDYMVAVGTSMASPFVAGAAGLVIQALEVNGNTWDFNSSSDASLVKMLLCATSTESNTNRETSTNNPTLQRAASGPNGYPVGKDQYEGYGMINVDAAVQAAQQNLTSGFSTNYSLGGSTTNARAWAGHFADNGRATYIGLTVPSGADFDLYLYSGSSDTNGDPVILASSTTASTTGNTESITYRPTSAATNYIVVKKISGSGTFSLVVSNISNDVFTNAYTISDASGSTAGTNKTFTTETGESVPTGCFASAWYNWTAPYTGIAAFIGSNCVPTLYTGSSVSALTKLTGQNVATTNVVSVSGGTTYRVQICSTNSAGTNFLFNWSMLVSQLNITNTTPITYTNSTITPYPSSNVISGVSGTITKATVTFYNYSDSQGAMELDSLLVSPSTNKIGLMVGSGDMTSFNNLTITFADGGAYPPSSSVLTNGTYEPSVLAAFLSFDSPAPARPYSTNLSDLIGQSPNGTWLLYIETSSSTTKGCISNWSMNLSIDVPPTFSINTTTLNYTNGLSSSNITTSAALSSLYYPNLSGGSLTVDVVSNADTVDTLTIANQGTGAGQIGAFGGLLSYGGTQIGTYTGGNNGSTPLVISFTSSAATLSVLQQLVTNIAFISTSSSTSTRTVEYIVADPNGGTATASKNIAVAVPNHAPTVANAIPSQTANYGSSFSYTFPANTFTDSDSGQTLTYTASGSILGTASGITFNSGTRTFSATTVDSGNGGTIAGSQTINVIATDNGTPPMSATNSFTLTINKAAASITPNAASRTYGAPNPTFSGTLSGFLAADAITATFATTATTNSAVGTYPITPTLTDSHNDRGNYTITTNSASLTISQAPVTVVANNFSRLYGATNPTFTATYNGLTNGQTFATSGISGSPSLTTVATTNSAIGTYTITNQIGTLSSLNYSFTFSNGTLTITRAALSLTTSNATRVYGATNPVFTGSLTGLANNDAITPTYSTTATTTSAPGTFPITATLADPQNKLPNYRVTTNNGTLTISKAALLVTATNATRAYGAANPTFGVTYSGFANGETETSGTISGAPLLTSAAATAPAGTYTITNSPGTLASSDYSFTFANGTLTVTQAQLTVTPNNAARSYGQANPVLTGTLSGLANNDNITAVYATTASTSSPIGTYPITATLNDPNSLLPNYSVTTNQGTLSVTNATGSSNYTATIISSNSLVAVAHVGTTNITFIDTNSGYGIVVALTLSPFSSNTLSPVFTYLDTFGPGGTAVHLGVDSGRGSGDGNWVDAPEGADFTASLISASTDIDTNSIQFGIIGMGVRPGNGGGFMWSSPVGTNNVGFSADTIYTLDTNTTPFSASSYWGSFRARDTGMQVQLSDNFSPTYNGLVLEASFHIGTVTGASATIGTASFSGGQIQFSISGTTGANYIIEATTDLSNPNWVPIYTNTAPFNFTDTNSGTYTQRFFRVVSQ